MVPISQPPPPLSPSVPTTGRLTPQASGPRLWRQGRLAGTLGVSKATITSDVRAILAMPAGTSAASDIKASAGRQP